MKETIVTIPINDLFAPKCGCPLCRMEEMLTSSVTLITVSRSSRTVPSTVAIPCPWQKRPRPSMKPSS